jgi:hypothetical protein
MPSVEFRLVLNSPDHGIVWKVFSYGGFDPPADKWSTSCRLESVRINGGSQVDLLGYLHMLDQPDREPLPTEREWIAKMYLPSNDETRWKLLGADGYEHKWLRAMLDNHPTALGASPMRWAFQGWTAQQVADTYGDGRQIYLTAPVADDGVTLLRGPREPGDRDIERRESLLEQAVEDGQLTGAMPAD